jgi:hypothetical protein
MLHSQIENEEIIERYVRSQLTPEERRAFEEHFFGCDECFAKLQATERFVAGIRDAANRGTLDAEVESAVPNQSDIWFKWAFAATASVALTLAVVTAWTYLTRMPKLRAELERTTALLQTEQHIRAELEQKAAPVEQAEANIPLVMLQASRAGGDESASVVLQTTARHLVLWIDIGPSRYRDFRLEVFSQDNRLLTSLDHLVPGPYGGLAASLPVDQLPAGDFRIRLSTRDSQSALLVGEYQLKVRRP